MTEAEWLASDDTTEMFGHASPYKALPTHSTRLLSRRVVSLFAAACVRATPPAADRPFLPRVVAAVERAAEDGDWAAVDALNARAGKRCERARLDSVEHFWELAALRLSDDSIDHYAFHVPFFLLKALDGSKAVPGLRRAYADTLRDVAGNPFRGGRGRRMKKPTKPHAFAVLGDAHVTPTVCAIARGVYESRDFSGMPILADALQEAGCENAAILDHCRAEHATHVCGCWVVDLVLGRA